MKTFMFALSTFLAATVIAGPFASPAYSQAPQSSRTVRDDRITVIIIKKYVGPDDFQQVPRTYRYPSAQTYARGQEEIRSNPAIRALLQRRGISFHNVSGVQTAFSGGKIVYVR